LAHRTIQVTVGVVLIGVGGFLAMSPLAVAEALGRPHDTTSQWINLRASWGGAVIGIAAFIAWLPALRPWWRALIGLVTWSMAGVGFARTIGFALDGTPDDRQLVWISAEAVIVIAGTLGLYLLGARAEQKPP
jgi:hypothetical protein